MTQTCIFCKIIDGSAPACIVYRDAQTIAFFPKHQDAFGHTLIAPVAHIADIFHAAPDVLSPLLATAHKLAHHYKQRVSAQGINLLHASGAAAQQSIPHFHVHLLPRFPGDALDAWPRFPKNSFNPQEQLEKLRLD